MKERIIQIGDVAWKIFHSATALFIDGKVRELMAFEAFQYAGSEGLAKIPRHILYTGWVLSRLGDRMVGDAMKQGLKMNTRTAGG